MNQQQFMHCQVRRKRSKVNTCATSTCGDRFDLKPHFNSAGGLYFLCSSCSFLLAALEKRIARVTSLVPQ